MVSAGALWVPQAERFQLPSLRCFHLDAALDSSGFVRGKMGAYPWTVAQYVELAWSFGWAWWSQMDLPCEEALAPDRADVVPRIEASAALHADCLEEARRVRSASSPTSLAARLTDPVPVMQGRYPSDYKRSGELLARVCGGELPDFVGVGSMCTRPTGGPDGLIAIVEALDAWLPPQVGLHLYGVKGDGLRALRGFSRVVSVDSMGWDDRARWAAWERFQSLSELQKQHILKTRTRNTVAHRVEVLRRWYAEQVASL